MDAISKPLHNRNFFYSGDLQRVCKATEFKCKTAGCINGTLKCNGVQDCFDGSDEFNCTSKLHLDSFLALDLIVLY